MSGTEWNTCFASFCLEERGGNLQTLVSHHHFIDSHGLPQRINKNKNKIVKWQLIMEEGKGGMEKKEKLENMLILPEFARHCNNKRSLIPFLVCCSFLL